MNVSEISIKASVTSSVENTSGTVSPKVGSVTGNALPVVGTSHVPSENPHGKVSSAESESEKLNGLVDQANKALAQRTSSLKFTVAKDTNIRVIEIVDTETGKVIRQIPSKQMVAIAQALKEIKQGAMLEDKA